MFEVGDRVQIRDHQNEWGSGIVAGIFENGALVTIGNGVHKGLYYFYFDELDMLDSYSIYDSMSGVYLELPHAKYFEDREPDESYGSEENETSTNEYVNITIHTKDSKSPAEYISDILKGVSQIKDRTVNITIM